MKLANETLRMAPTAFSDAPWATGVFSAFDAQDVRDVRAGRGPKGVYGTRNSRNARRYLTPSVVAMWVAFAVMVACNVLFEMARLGGVTTAEASSSVFAWFTPAGYVFAIWGLIYAALAVWLVRYTRKARRASARTSGSLTKVAVLFIASCALNVAWLALFHFQQLPASILVISALWITLVALYREVHVIDEPSLMGRAAGWAPISLYVGWITVAVLANASHVVTRMTDVGVPLVGEVSTLVLVAAVLLAGYFMRQRYGDVVIPLVFLWAIVGVGVHLLAVSVPMAVIVFALAAGAAFVTFVPADALRSPAHAR